MASERYVCRECDMVQEIENRKKNKVCWLCGSWCELLYTVTVVNKTLYNGSSCYSTDKLTIPTGVTAIDDYAFRRSSIRMIEFPESLKEIPGFCFAECRLLKEVTIPGTIQKIGFEAFEKCPDLEEVVISEGVTEIGSYAFYQCANLRSVVLPKSLKKIDVRAFYECSSLEEIIIPEGVATIGDAAFAGCQKLKYISLPSTLEKLGSRAFYTAIDWPVTIPPSIKIVFLPSKIKEFGEEVFEASIKDGKGQQHITYHASKGSAAEAYLKSEGFIYTIFESKTGYAVGDEVHNHTLYYMDKPGKKTAIPKTVCRIAENAFLNCTKIEEVTIPDTVTEIGAHAFQGCVKLSTLTFTGSSTLKKIGSKAFSSFAGKIVDLPASVVDIADDAFPGECIVSVDGEMPNYASELARMDEQRITIDAKKKQVAALKVQLEDAKTKLSKHTASLPPRFEKIPDLQEKLRNMKEARDAERKVEQKEKTHLCNRLSEVERHIRVLVSERENCSFLAFTKKRKLEEDIARKHSDWKSIQDDLQKFSDKCDDNEKRSADLAAPLQKKLYIWLDEQTKWKNTKLSLSTKKDGIDREIKSLSADITKLNEMLKKDEEALLKAHDKWVQAKEKTIQLVEQEKQAAKERESRKELEQERNQILSQICIPACPTMPLFRYKCSGLVVDEKLLNEAFLHMITDLNREQCTTAHNQYIKANADKIEQVKAINTLLGYTATQDIKDYVPLPVPEMADTYIPERVSILSNRFAKSEYWKKFKHSAIDLRTNKNKTATIHDKFFAGSDYFALRSDNRYLLMFSYCLVIFEEKKPMSVFTYDKAELTIQYVDQEEIRNDIPPFGELLHERHKHLNADGSVSRRYKDNPIVKTIRYTTVTIQAEAKNISFTFPTQTWAAAMQFENAFHGYCKALLSGPAGNVYSLVANSADCNDIISALDDLAKEEARLRKLDEQRKAEEEKRLEEERIAAEKAAEERKKAIIQKQRELNAARKREAERLAEEKKRVMQLFNDDLDAVNSNGGNSGNNINDAIEEAGSDDSMIPIEIVGNRLISNNVFKVTLTFVEECKSESLIAYFVTNAGETISNKKKVAAPSENMDITIGFVLKSGIDYTTMSECLMRFESQGEILGDIRFKMNISFYSDF